ncbi:hypothetical protein EV426DRAFT_703059 [Tirmania nivea]|nr:hypothetical protein EV426DRAFT_703059 [Tirmania nivea]
MSSRDHTDMGSKELKTLLPLCKLDELVKYSRSHLWIDPSGGLGDLDASEVPAVKWGWIEQGWRYDLQDIDDKHRVRNLLTHLNQGAMRTQEDALHQASDHPLLCSDTQDYLNLLLKFLISELLMNTIRYDRGHTEMDIQVSYQGAKHHWDRFVDRLLDTCKVEADQLPNVATYRINNMMCILIMYLQEATYTGEEAKRARGKWGKALWSLQAQESETLRALDLRCILSAEALHGAYEQVLPCRRS